MQKSFLAALATCSLFLAAAAPGAAGGLSVFASQWDTSDAGDSLGWGVALGIPLGSTFDLDLRASRFDDFEDEPVARLFPGDAPQAEVEDVEATPLEVGLRLKLGRDRGFNPYLGAGVSYFLLDSSRMGVEVDDEVGFYGLVGARLGDGRGADLFVEALWRQVEATAEDDPGSIGDLDDIDFDDRVDLDLGGFAVQAGLVWSW